VKECAANRCGQRAVSSCSWRMSEVDSDGTRVFTGEKCGMRLCEAHRREIGKRVLCDWHAMRAKELT